MKKEIYLEKIKERTGVPKKTCDLILKEFLFILKEELAQTGKANIVNFGTFAVKKTKPHSFFSPVDGRTIKTTGITKVYFSSSKELLKILSRSEYGNN
jgi:nucleoid DNA-binding protein